MADFICYPRVIPYGETYNCHECTDMGCEHWGDYNLVDDEECTEEELLEIGRKYNVRVLNPDIAEFFNATCERYRKE